MAWAYSATAGAGTLAVTNGGTTVTGTGTAFTSNFGTGGGAIIIAGVPYVVQAVAGATSLTLASPYLGATASGVAYTFNALFTQSGTDADLSGLLTATGSPPAALLSVVGTTLRAGGGVSNAPRRVFSINGARVVINGSLTINPTNEALHLWGAQPGQIDIQVNSGGTLTIAGVESFTGTDPNGFGLTIQNMFSMETVLYGNRQANGSSVGSSFLRVLSGGSYVARGGMIASDGAVSFDAGSSALFNNHLISGTLLGNRQVILGTTALTFEGPLTVRKMRTSANISNLTLTGFAPQNQRESAIDFGGGVVNLTLNDFAPSNVWADAWLRNNTSIRVFGTPAGSGIKLRAFRDSVNAANGGAAVVYSRVAMAVRDAAGASIDAVVVCRDTNNGARFDVSGVAAATGTYGAEFNLLADRTYLWTVTGGAAPAQDVLLMGTFLASGANGLTRVVDYRNVANAPGDDRFNFDAWSYGFRTARVAPNVAGTGTITVSAAMIPDANVTLSEAVAGALTAIATLDDLYDAAKHWKTRPVLAQLEYPSATSQPVDASGSVVDLGASNLVVDPAQSIPA